MLYFRRTFEIHKEYYFLKDAEFRLQRVVLDKLTIMFSFKFSVLRETLRNRI